MNSIEIVGRSKEDATEKALKKLGLKIEQVDVVVLAEIKPFLGFIGKPECKIKVTPKEGVKREESLENFDVGADFFKSVIKEEKKYEKQKKQETKKEQPVKVEDQKKVETENEENLKQELKKEEKNEEGPQSIYLEEDVKKIDLSSIYRIDTSKEDEKPEKLDRIRKKPVLTKEIQGRIESFLNNIFAATGIEATYEIVVGEESLYVSVQGDDAARLIGRRGDSLDSLQLLIGLAANKGEDEYTRVVLDIEKYREKREESIIRYANKMARQSAKQKRSVKLDVMNPYERRIVHAALQNDRFVTTSSEGKEPYRRVVIMPKLKREK